MSETKELMDSLESAIAADLETSKAITEQFRENLHAIVDKYTGTTTFNVSAFNEANEILHLLDRKAAEAEKQDAMKLREAPVISAP